MISLITGMPGAGKTSLMVYMLMTRKDLQNRPLYVDGIPELTISHQDIPDGQDMTTWYEWAPPGAVLVIDEAQRIFRPRSAGSKVPEYVQQLETHRHKGIDIFVLTQHPRLIDVNLRSLIGEHRNISKTMLGLKRVTYWQRCANPESRADVGDGKSAVFLMKRSAFGKYKSAEEHTKIKGSASLWVYSLPILIMATAYGAYYISARYDKMQQPEQVQQQHQQANETPSIPIQDIGTYSASDSHSNNLKPEEFKPSIDGKPWTAPIYNAHNRNIQTMPFPVGCIKSETKCTCYTDQATPIHEIDNGLCLDFVNNGIYNPYKAQQPIQKHPFQVEPSQSEGGVS